VAGNDQPIDLILHHRNRECGIEFVIGDGPIVPKMALMKHAFWGAREATARRIHVKVVNNAFTYLLSIPFKPSLARMVYSLGLSCCAPLRRVEHVQGRICRFGLLAGHWLRRW
jgi:hypothetical protein